VVWAAREAFPVQLSIGERTCIQMIRIHELVCQHESRSVTVSQGPRRRHQRLDHQEVVSISVDPLMQAPCSPMPAKRTSEYQLLFDGYGTRAGDAASCKPDGEGPLRSTVTSHYCVQRSPFQMASGTMHRAGPHCRLFNGLSRPRKRTAVICALVQWLHTRPN